ncbi:tyrosine-type recombinase/integrase (plasmid) [Kozakia baliensis]|uniref:tyrosine-type recombinase/integrase n=1 Tax=Kozakia baliensis TaxID=153496 RepID=UPI00345BB5D9
MLSDVRVLGAAVHARCALLERVDRRTRERLDGVALSAAAPILSSARFTPPLPLLLAGHALADGNDTPDYMIGAAFPDAATAEQAARRHLGDAPSGFDVAVGLEIEEDAPRFVAWLRRQERVPVHASDPPSPPPAPVGQAPATVARWFALVSAQPVPQPDGTLRTARQAVEAYVQRSKAANTLRSYRAAVRSWCQWASAHDLPALPARSEDVAAYLADMALRQRKTRTLDLHRAALRYLHHLAQITVPTSHPLVAATLAGIRREADHPAPVQKTALTWEKLTQAVDAMEGDDLVALRDRAILLLGFAGAFRRSELAGLAIQDIAIDDEGLQIRLTRSKGDPAAKGVFIGIPRGITRHCPVRAYEAWLRASGLTEGPIFRRVWRTPLPTPGVVPPRPKIGAAALSDRSVAEIVRQRCGSAGLEGDFSGHSLRRGAISTGAQDGYDLLELKRFSRHKSLQVVETYVDAASVKKRHPGRSRF